MTDMQWSPSLNKPQPLVGRLAHPITEYPEEGATP